MLVDSLRDIVKAAERALQLIGFPLSADPSVIALASDELEAYIAVVLSQHEGLLRQLIVLSDSELAGAIAERCVPASASDTGGKHGAIRSLVATFECVLAESAAWYRPSHDIYTFGPGAVGTHVLSRQTFGVVLPTPGGVLTIVVVPTTRTSTGVKASKAEDVDASMAQSFSADESRGILSRLISGEREVTLELGRRASGAITAPGIVLATARQGDKRALVLATPALSNDRFPMQPGTNVAIHMRDVKGLVTFRSSVLCRADVPIHRCKLPAVAVEFPSKVVGGNRRSAFRVVPERELTVIVSRRVETSPAGVLDTEGQVTASVRNISFTGSLVTSRERSFIAYLAMGTTVHCEIALPLPWGKIGLLGLVRHGRAREAEDGEPVFDAGIDFVPDGIPLSDEATLDSLKEYVLAQQQALTKKRAA